MKTPKSILAALLPVVCFTLVIVMGIGIKTNKPIKSPKAKRPMIHTWFEIEQPATSNIFILEGLGTETSGSVDNYQQGCINSDHTVDAGTSSGTYSYDSGTGVMTLDVEVTPSGYSEFTFIGSPISFNYTGYNALNCPN